MGYTSRVSGHLAKQRPKLKSNGRLILVVDSQLDKMTNAGVPQFIAVDVPVENRIGVEAQEILWTRAGQKDSHNPRIGATDKASRASTLAILRSGNDAGNAFVDYSEGRQ